MKQHKVLLFILSVFLILFAVWYVYPSKGISVGNMKLRFPSYQSYLADLRDSVSSVDVDSVLLAMQKSYEMVEGSSDTLRYYYDYITSNPNRISLPEDDYTFFDSLFAEMACAVDSGRTVRILHYGDSQLEMDRITAVLRQDLQERFGGSGPGMVPMIQRIPTVSLSQSASGGLTRYAMVGDSLTKKASHKRYGPLTQFTDVSGSGTFTFNRTKNRYSQELVKSISKVSVLLGRNSAGFGMTLKCDTLPERKAVIDSACESVSMVSWEMPCDVERGSVKFSGNAEIYGIMLDGEGGVAVDNVALRGCAGYIFSSINRQVMKESFAKTDTRLIILQFGGNAMPGIASRKAISNYVRKIVMQFDYFKEVAPQAKLMFIGPADMCKSVDGNRITWPLLEQLNDSLKVNSLKNGVAYWDTFSVMGGPGSMKEWVNHNPALAGPDHIHFTHRGALEIGNALARSFLLYHDFYKLRQELTDEAVGIYLRNLRDSLNPRPVVCDTLTNNKL